MNNKTICTVSQRNATRAIKYYLASNRAIVFTGRSKEHFHENCQVGKSTTLMTSVVPELRKWGLRVQYFDLHYEPSYDDEIGDIRYGRMSRQLRMRDSLDASMNVIVVDDVHYMIGPPDDRSYKWVRGLSLKIWEKIERMSGNTRFVFSTALHPFNSAYQEYESPPGSQVFTGASVILEFLNKAPHVELFIRCLLLHNRYYEEGTIDLLSKADLLAAWQKKKPPSTPLTKFDLQKGFDLIG